MDQARSALFCASQSGSPTLPAPFPWPGPAMGSSGGAWVSAEASEMWQSLRLLRGGRQKKESQEHLCAKGLGVLGTRWWWSHQPGSGTSCQPSCVRGDKLLGLSGPLLFSVTQGASAFCYPPEKGPQAVMSSLADVTAGQMDFSTLTLEGMCPKLAGEDMPAVLPAQGMWKSLQACSMACRGPSALRGISLEACQSRQQQVEGEEDGARSLTADALCPGIPRTAAMAEQPFGSSLS